MLKDYWGNDAIDFGSMSDLIAKYNDKIFVTVTNRPFGDSYVLFVCDANEEEKADKFLDDFHTVMKSKGIAAYGAGTSLGADLLSKRMDGFIGGIGT